MRIGQGFDAHRFGPGDHLMLGCVRIDHSQGIRAHSDGDVVVHALCDALLGAAGLGDIGRHFPDTDPAFKDLGGADMLGQVYERASARAGKLVNADVTVVAQQPRLAGYIPRMQERLAQIMAVEPVSINIKATTTEGMGWVGREEGIAVLAVVLLTGPD